jgi:ATP-dependent Clp protease adapter protein ClpS
LDILHLAASCRNVPVTFALDVTFMGIIDFLQDLLPARRYRPSRAAPEYFLTSPPLRTDLDLAQFLLTAPEVEKMLASSSISAEPLRERLSSVQRVPSDESYEQLRVVLDAVRGGALVGAAPHLPAAAQAYLVLVALASPQLRPLLVPSGQALGDLPFRFAHGMTEAEAVAGWGENDPALRAVEVVNDRFTPMQEAVSALAESLGLDTVEASLLALKTHGKGAVLIEPPTGKSAWTFCLEANKAWRERGLALFCRPARASDV